MITRRVLASVVAAAALVGCSSGSSDGAAGPSTSGSATSASRTVTTAAAPSVDSPVASWMVEFGPGVATTPPAIAGNTVVVGDAAGVLRAYDREGVLRWERQLEDRSGEVLEQVWVPVIVDGVVVTGGNTSEAIPNGVAVGVDLDDGTVEWRLDEFEGWSDRSGLPLTTDGELVFVAMPWMEAVYAIDPAVGRTRWQAELDGWLGARFTIWAVDDLVVASMVSGLGARTVALDAATGAQRWEIEDEETVAAASIDGEIILELDRGTREPRAMVGVDPADGTQRWSVSGASGAGPLGLATSGNAIVTVSREEMAMVDAGSAGGVRWRVDNGAYAITQAFTTPPLVVDDQVFVGGTTQGRDEGAFVRVYDLADGTLLSDWSTNPGTPVALDLFDDGELAIAVDPLRDALQGGLAAVNLAPAPQPGPARAPVEPPSVLLGIPSPSEALTAENAAYAGGILALLMVLVAIPTTLFNSALEQHLDALRRFRLRRSGRRPTADSVVAAPPSARGRHPWMMVIAYTGAGALLYSLLQPSWGANAATVITALSFWMALIVLTSVERGSIARHERARYATSTGRPVLSFATLAFGALCVAGSRAIAFVPGYLYGVVVDHRTDTELSGRDQADITLVTSIGVFVVSVGAWFSLGAFTAGFGTSGIASLPTGIAAGIFMAGIETLLVGLLPLRLLPGAELRRHHPIAWKGLWAASAFLFALALLHPGLASAKTRSTGWILFGAAVYGSIAVAFWWLTSRRGQASARAAVVPPVVVVQGVDEREVPGVLLTALDGVHHVAERDAGAGIREPE